MTVCVSLGWLQDSPAQEVRIDCTAKCEVSYESDTYPDSAIAAVGW